MTSARAVTTVLRVVATAAIAVVALSGCFTLKMELAVQSDNTVDGSIILAVDKSLADLAGGEDQLIESLRSGDNSLFTEEPSQGSLEAREYRDADRVGVEYLISDVPLTEFGEGSEGDLSITRVDDTFVVDGVLNLSSGIGGQNPEAEAMVESADIRLSITFPGEVGETNGEVSGRTVTWAPQPGEREHLSAIGKAESGFPVGILIGAGLVVMLVLIAVVLRMTLRGRASPSVSDPEPPR